MKSKKKHIFIILVMCMAWSLCACGNNASVETDKAQSELESILDSEKQDNDKQDLNTDTESSAIQEDQALLEAEKELLAILNGDWMLEYNGGSISFAQDGTCSLNGVNGSYTAKSSWYEDMFMNEKYPVLELKLEIGDKIYNGSFDIHGGVNSNALYINCYEGAISESFYATLTIDKATNAQKVEFLSWKLNMLCDNPTEFEVFYGNSQEFLAQCYEILIGIKDYEGVQEILDGFTLLENVPLYMQRVQVDAFGQVSTERPIWMIYDHYGNPIMHECGLETMILGFDNRNDYEPKEVKYQDEKIVEMVFGWDDTIKQKTFFEYDSTGKILKETNVYSSGNSKEKLYEYDSDGNVVKITHNSDANGEMKIYKCQEISYDANGNKISEIVYGWYSNGERYIDDTMEYLYEGDRLVEMKADSITGSNYNFVGTYSYEEGKTSCQVKKYDGYNDGKFIEEYTQNLYYGTYYLYER